MQHAVCQLAELLCVSDYRLYSEWKLKVTTRAFCNEWERKWLKIICQVIENGFEIMRMSLWYNVQGSLDLFKSQTPLYYLFLGRLHLLIDQCKKMFLILCTQNYRVNFWGYFFESAGQKWSVRSNYIRLDRIAFMEGFRPVGLFKKSADWMIPQMVISQMLGRNM